MDIIIVGSGMLGYFIIGYYQTIWQYFMIYSCFIGIAVAWIWSWLNIDRINFTDPITLEKIALYVFYFMHGFLSGFVWPISLPILCWYGYKQYRRPPQQPILQHAPHIQNVEHLQYMLQQAPPIHPVQNEND